MMGKWINLFARREDFSSVVIPLADSPAPNKSPRSGDSGSDNEPKDKGEDPTQDVGTASAQENGAAPVAPKGMLTIDVLRSEVETAVGASSHDTVYDRMFHVTFYRNSCGLGPKFFFLFSLNPCLLFTRLRSVEEGLI